MLLGNDKSRSGGPKTFVGTSPAPALLAMAGRPSIRLIVDVGRRAMGGMASRSRRSRASTGRRTEKGHPEGKSDGRRLSAQQVFAPI
jgi:hypothetical protein